MAGTPKSAIVLPPLMGAQDLLQFRHLICIPKGNAVSRQRTALFPRQQRALKWRLSSKQALQRK